MILRSDSEKQAADPEKDPGTPELIPGDATARRLLWKDSPEGAKFHKQRFLIVLGVAVLSIVGSAYGATLEMNAERSTSSFETTRIVVNYLGALLAVGGLTWMASAVTEQSRRKEFEDRLRLGMSNKLGNEEKALAESAVDGRLDLPGLWAVNQERIEYYHRIALAQAENSYKMGQLAGLAGFIAVVALGVLAAFADNGTASIAAAAVGVAGAAMSGYIGVTFMKIQAESSAQFRQFFQQPVEFSRLLGAERLVETLEPEHRSDAVKQIVLALMTSPNSAGNDSRTL